MHLLKESHLSDRVGFFRFSRPKNLSINDKPEMQMQMHLGFIVRGIMYCPRDDFCIQVRYGDGLHQACRLDWFG